MSEPSRYRTQYGLMAEKHWREFRPKMVRELEAQGRLTEALWEAQETTIDEMDHVRIDENRWGRGWAAVGFGPAVVGNSEFGSFALINVAGNALHANRHTVFINRTAIDFERNAPSVFS